MNQFMSNQDHEIELNNLYGRDEKILDYQKNRYKRLTGWYNDVFKISPEKYFSSPGRTEISGNHTDHNHGKVISASINLDSIASVAKSQDTVEIYSEGYAKPFIVKLEHLDSIDGEIGTTNALVRGIASRFVQKGLIIGGFKACITSDVLQGSGLSSSASIEVLIGTIFNHLYNDGKILPEEIAKIGKYAENVYFKKPCGLMDQITCAVGGTVSIDFHDAENPNIKKINFDFQSVGYKILVLDTEANHVNLIEEYAAIPSEMKQVANYFNKEFCSEISFGELISEIKSLRKIVNDRAILRAIHFLNENSRVERQKAALNQNNFEEFLSLVNESGDSSFKYLQNIYSHRNFELQEVSIALSLSELFINEKGVGACRIHGGGFGGTIQVFLPENLIGEFKLFISKVFKEDSMKILSVRNFGAVCLTNLHQ